VQDDPSPAVRRALALAYGAHGGDGALAGLARLAVDHDPEVVSAAVKALGTLRPASRAPDARAAAEIQAGASRALAAAYGHADAIRRAEIAEALQKVGTSLREAVEAEARLLWERNVRGLAGRGPDRAGAAEELGHSGRAEASRRLLAILGESRDDPRLSMAAVQGLGACADAEGRRTLEDLVGEGSAEMAEAAAAALAELGDPAAADALAVTASGGRGRAAAAAAAALEELPATTEAGVGLCEVALRSPDPGLAARAARAARSRSVDCPDRPLANRIARRGPETAAALAAYGELRPVGERPDGPGARAMALLEPPVELSLRVAAAQALGKAGHAPARAPLGKRARILQDRLERGRAAGGADAGDVQELGAVAVALARLRSPEAAALAQHLAGDPDARLRSAAAEALGAVEAEGSLETLARLLADPDAAVREAATRSLGRRGGAAAPVLAQALARAPDGSQASLARALGETGSPEAVKALAPLLEGPAAGVAAQALGQIGAREGVEPLLALLARGASRGRVEAIEALGQLGDPGAGRALVLEMTSDRPEIRAAAARATGKLRHDAASPRLEALRADYYGEVRRAAVEALAKLPVRATPAPVAPDASGQ
jgi:HEAT repeat protein